MNPRYSRYYTFIKPIMRNTQVRTYSGLVFSLFAVAIFAIFAIKPTVSTIISLQKSINEETQIFDSLKTKAQNLSDGRENLKKIDPQTLTKLNNLLPSKTDPASLIQALNTVAASNQASISGLQLQPTELIGAGTTINKNAPLREIPFTFNVAGSYQNLVTIISSISLSPRLISVDSISLTQGDQGLVMSVNARAYFLDNR